MTRQLSRSRTNSMIAGVCGGLGATLAIDPVLIRLFFVLLTLGGGAGVLLYLVLWIIMPLEGAGAFGTKETMQASSAEIAAHARGVTAIPDRQTALLIGGVLIGIGIIALLRALHLPWMMWMHGGTIWPLLLIVAGSALLVRRSREV